MSGFNSMVSSSGFNSGFGSAPGGNDMFSMIRQMLMTSLIFKNVNNSGGSGYSSGTQDYFSIIYVFLITQLIDVMMKYMPMVFDKVYSKYFVFIEQTKNQMVPTNSEQNIKGVNIPKKKSSSVIISVNITDIENVLGQALLEHITNHKSTQHTYYTKQHFILNQQDVLCIGDDIYSCMTENSMSKGNNEYRNDPNKGQNRTEDSIVQIIEVFSYEKNNKELREFLNNVRKNYIITTQNKLGTQRYFFNMFPLSAPLIRGSEFMHGNNGVPIHNTNSIPNHAAKKDLSKLPNNFLFNMKPFETNRSFINLFGEEIELIKKRVKFFIDNKKWYDEKGIPYTLGLLLSGAPGTGKTSTIKCLANETNRHIVNINFNNDITKTQLENLFFNENIVVNNPHTMQQEKYCIPLNQRIYVLEDVDCQGNITHDRSFNLTGSSSSEIDPHKVDLSFLLNLLDGVLETPGRIVIMTSNFPEILDKALIRPGRIDIISEFKKCSNNTIIEMLEFFYDTKLTMEQRDCILQLHARIITPAELSKVMFENFYNMKDSIDHLTALSRQMDSQFPAEKNEMNTMIEFAKQELSYELDTDNHFNRERYEECKTQAQQDEKDKNPSNKLLNREHFEEFKTQAQQDEIDGKSSNVFLDEFREINKRRRRLNSRISKDTDEIESRREELGKLDIIADELFDKVSLDEIKTEIKKIDGLRKKINSQTGSSVFMSEETDDLDFSFLRLIEWEHEKIHGRNPNSNSIMQNNKPRPQVINRSFDIRKDVDVDIDTQLIYDTTKIGNYLAESNDGQPKYNDDTNLIGNFGNFGNIDMNYMLKPERFNDIILCDTEQENEKQISRMMKFK